MQSGTISDLDTDGLVGLIDADDGHLVFFNLLGMEPSSLAHFRVGARVQFIESADALAPRALNLSTLRGPRGSA